MITSCFITTIYRTILSYFIFTHKHGLFTTNIYYNFDSDDKKLK